MEFRLMKYIAVDVKDYESSVAFYRDTLGWELVTQGPKESHFRKADTNFFIAEDTNTPYTTYFEYEVDDIEAAKTKLLSERCTMHPSGKPKSYMVKDAYGMHFHVYEKGAF
jgi:catechol 2,3-dioxygenase-like lactoylglutathione lyase family enzyme